MSDKFYKLLFIEAGKGVYQIDGKTFIVMPGTFIAALSNKKLNLSKLDGTGWLIQFRDIFDHKEYLTTNPALERLNIPVKYSLNWLERLALINNECKNSQMYSEEYARTLLELILIDIHRISNEKLLKFNPLVDKAIQFIENNYTQPISLSNVALFVDRSPSYLASIFREVTGSTVLQWISQRRMLKAQSLLIQTKQTIEEISEEVGYLDPRYFNRKFKKKYGVTPAKWRSIKNLEDQ